MKIAVIGLGLVGGSIAKSIKNKTDNEVFVWDLSKDTRENAISSESVHGILQDGNPKDCDVVIIALYTGAVINYIEQFQSSFKKGAWVIDCAGVKEKICKEIPKIAEKNGFVFCGGHPMAGKEKSGFEFADDTLFDGATMILTPDSSVGENLNNIGDFFRSIGFGNIKISSPSEHDKVIAYTSQLAHVVSSAYVKKDLSSEIKGFSAGSFRDMTRVAKLNEDMWTELFLENSEYLADEVDSIIVRLQEFSDYIRNKKADELKAVLKQNKESRLSIDNEKRV